MPKPVSKPRKKAAGYKMPLPLPNGLVLEDIAKKKWKLGPSIGSGGFGEIYCAQALSSNTEKGYPYVVKIEPHANGPLFVEMHFYMRAAKPIDVASFKTEKKLSSFGMPEYLGSGSHDHSGEKYRFLVMHKFGTDIWKLFVENKRRFPVDTVFKLGVQILDVLEYIHGKGYIHGDIKGANILLGTGKEAEIQVYLVDFGLCTHYANIYKPDPRKAHNGTIEYLSRDAHLGVESRRGDLEILGYNLTQWLGCTLPWENNIADPVSVQNSKETNMANLTNFFKACFKSHQPPAALVDYFKYITSLKFETNPDYKKLRRILLSGVETAGGSLKSSLKFRTKAVTTPKRKVSKSRSPVKRRSAFTKGTDADTEDLNESEIVTKTTRSKHNKRNSNSDESDEDAANSSSSGYTAEMIRIKHIVDTKKKQKGKLNGGTLKLSLKSKTKSITTRQRISRSLSPRRKHATSVKGIRDANGDLSENEILTKTEISKQKKRNSNYEESEEEDLTNTEILRLKPKLDAKKNLIGKINVSSSRDLRKRKHVNYNQNSLTSNGEDLSDSVVVISNSESEEEVVTKKRIIRNK